MENLDGISRGDEEIDVAQEAEIHEQKPFSPSEFIGVLNETLAFEFSPVFVEGEVASFKVSQGKWVFFDLKDETASVNCFLPLWKLRVPLEDGMKILVKAMPKLTAWGRFSLTVETMQPVGEGSLKRAFLMLKKKLTAEGLFAPEKKRPIPRDLATIGVISSTGAAGYADFIKILNARWGGMKVIVAHTQVQGLEAPDQIRRALEYFNERGEVQAIAILRGGGSADDLAAFNDEALVRAVAASKIPVIAGIGHEVDESLVDLAADLRASTPSNAAELITRDRREVSRRVRDLVERTGAELAEKVALERRETAGKIERIGQGILAKYIEPLRRDNQEKILQIEQKICSKLENAIGEVRHKIEILEVLNPEKVLKQGYAILSGEMAVGSVVKITTFESEAEAKIQAIAKRGGK